MRHGSMKEEGYFLQQHTRSVVQKSEAEIESEDQDAIIFEAEERVYTNIPRHEERIRKLFRPGELQDSINWRVKSMIENCKEGDLQNSIKRRVVSIIDNNKAFFKVFHDGFSGEAEVKEIDTDESLKNQICN